MSCDSHVTWYVLALKRSRSEVEKLSNLSLCLSPNGGCIAVTTCEGTVSVIVLSPFVLGGKGKTKLTK